MQRIRELYEFMLLEEEERKLAGDDRIAINRQSFKNARKAWENMRNVYYELKNELTRTEKIIKSLERELLGLANKIKEIDQKLYGEGTNLKQIEQYQFKLELLKNEKTDKEERLLDMISREEELKEEAKKLKENLIAEKDKLLKWQEEIKFEEEEYRRNLEALRQKLNREEERLTENPYYAKYKELKEKYGNPVALVDKETCYGCFMSLPFELTKKLKLGQGEGAICPHCKRLLYYPS
ncbi:zinc ribbon domain-containing protein [Carboxydothermus pertinax]|uniref:C4-type zinc ribbon domain-containing protein n=1 Tax=Carboxydothermus pertinax TaxID=870242 RepID=A0A1L8CWQ9_9THEO|nr:C4-type zinc ribbon domain-containing protein [Carboxydothermus pertinax]GAV23337.1 hypothetical protein cpu_18470 [Carboxydothermus pertinax]